MDNTLMGIIVTALIGVIGILLKIAILNPISEWPKQLEETKLTQQKQETCLVSAQSSARSAHHRIDGLEERVNSLERR